MKEPLVSINVPVYNAEIYLDQCLGSLLRQTLQDIEIVIVNDGSTDGSEAICREYASKDSRIKLITKENGGSASARQTALDASTGFFVCSCDADDWMEPNMVEDLYKKAIKDDVDIVSCDYWREYYNGKKVVCKYPFQIEERNDLLDDVLNKRFPVMVWNKIFKRSLFEKYNLSWEMGINMGEDFLMMMKILSLPVKVVHLPKPLYHYRRIVDGASYTNNVSLSIFNQLLMIRKWSDQNIDKKKYQNGLFLQWLDQAFAGLRVMDGMTEKYFKETALNNIPYRNFIKYSYPKLKGLIVLISKLLGYRIGRIIVKFMYRFIYH